MALRQVAVGVICIEDRQKTGAHRLHGNEAEAFIVGGGSEDGGAGDDVADRAVVDRYVQGDMPPKSSRDNLLLEHSAPEVGFGADDIEMPIGMARCEKLHQV